jgi:hypothetical protein
MSATQILSMLAAVNDYNIMFNQFSGRMNYTGAQKETTSIRNEETELEAVPFLTQRLL